MSDFVYRPCVECLNRWRGCHPSLLFGNTECDAVGQSISKGLLRCDESNKPNGAVR